MQTTNNPAYSSQDSIEKNLNTLTKAFEDYKEQAEQKFASLEERKIPSGVIQAFAYERNIPKGWLQCDGTAVSREKYPDLFKAIGTTFGAGDQSTTFNVPDLRGLFVRGWPGGEFDPKRAFGSVQTDAIREIQGSCGRLVDADRAGTIYEANGENDKEKWTTGAFEADETQGYAKSVKNLSAEALFEEEVEDPKAAKHPKAFKFKASNVVPTANEVRPVNIALLFCIKA